jgi:hypothetical protein
MKKAFLLLVLASLAMGTPDAAMGANEGGRSGPVYSIDELESLSLQGDAVAQNRLGVMYKKGLGVPQNNRLAIRWLLKAAKQGNAVAQFNLGFMYREGLGVQKDLYKAQYWFGKAAEQGDAYAQSNLGVMYSFGQGVGRSDQVAMDWFHKASKNQYTNAQEYLGVKFDIGLEAPVDYKQAATWYRTAAENYREGSWGSNKDDLSTFYLNGLAAPKRFLPTTVGSQKSKESIVALEQFETGFKYYSGRYGLQWDYKFALHWFKKAAEQGNAVAQYNVGYMYHYGEGAPQDFRMAVEWYRKAAQQGYSRAQNNLGVMYAKGFGVPQDSRVAGDWIRKAAEGGNAIAQNTLAFMYETGLVLPQDFKLAVTWYRSAVEAAGTDAQWNAGGRDGQIHNDPPHGLEGFDQLGVDDLRKAAEKNNAGAQTLLGIKYSRGDGVEVDYQKAAYWYRRAASQGNAWAQHMLAGAYGIGDGVTRSHIASYALSNLASDRYSIAAVKNSTTRMSAAELESGQALTRELAVPGKFLQALDGFIASNASLPKITTDSSAIQKLARTLRTSDGHFPAPPEQMNSCNTRCIAGKCWRTFGDGRKLRFHATQIWSESKRKIAWDSGSC